MTEQLFPIFDSNSGKFLNYQKRNVVHTKGHLHKAIHANVIRKNSIGTFDILIQIRSGGVDIAKHKYDQSLATQMTASDRLTEVKSLQRGLLTELGISNFVFREIESGIKIVKTYEYDTRLLNSELLYLFLVKAEDHKEIGIMSQNIKAIRWVEWHSFLRLIKENNVLFTKTSQFYFLSESILNHIEKESYDFLGVRNWGISKSSISAMQTRRSLV